MAERIKTLEVALSESRRAHSRKEQYLILGTLAFAIFSAGVFAGARIGPIGSPSTLPTSERTKNDFEEMERAFADSNYPLAMNLALPLAQNGSSRAQVIVGEISYHDKESLRDDAQAMKWFKMAAKQSDPVAQFHIGEMYSQGDGAPQDYAEAARWYRLAAEQGYARAQYNLGLAYTKGDGVPKDIALAYIWFNIAASRFHASASSDRALAVKNRDIVASRLSQSCLLEAQKRSREWQPNSAADLNATPSPDQSCQ